VLFHLGDCAWATEVEIAMADRMARGIMIFFMMEEVRDVGGICRRFGSSPIANVLANAIFCTLVHT
jgi:hypothetical protein